MLLATIRDSVFKVYFQHILTYQFISDILNLLQQNDCFNIYAPYMPIKTQPLTEL